MPPVPNETHARDSKVAALEAAGKRITSALSIPVPSKTLVTKATATASRNPDQEDPRHAAR